MAPEFNAEIIRWTIFQNNHIQMGFSIVASLENSIMKLGLLYVILIPHTIEIVFVVT